MRNKWRMIFAWGDTDHPTGGFAVDPDFYRGLLYAFKRLRDEHKYLPPITAMHPEIMAELSGEAELRGANYGVIAGLKADEDGIWAGFALNALGRRLDALGALQYLSPSFYKAWVDPHTGEQLGPVLREVSFVDVPHQKNISAEIGQIYGLSDAVSLAEAGFQTTITSEDMMEEEIMEEASVESTDVLTKEHFDARMDEILALLVPSDNVDGETSEEESIDMSERVASLERELKIERASSKVRADLGALATDDLVKSLAPMSLSDAAGYKAVLAGIKKAPAQAPVGNVGQPAPAKVQEGKLVSLCEQAAKSGISRGLPLVKYLRAHGMADEQIHTSLAEHGESIKRIYSAMGGK